MKKRFWDADKVLSISAFLISLMTLVVFFYQTRLMREQQHQSVLPYLAVGFRHTGSPDFHLYLSNDGIGPAFIESVKVTYQGKEYEMDLPNFLASQVPAMDTINNYLFSNIYRGKMIAAGEVIEIIKANNSMKVANQLKAVLDQLNDEGLNYEIIYRSVYDDKWRLTGDSSIPEEL